MAVWDEEKPRHGWCLVLRRNEKRGRILLFLVLNGMICCGSFSRMYHLTVSTGALISDTPKDRIVTTVPDLQTLAIGHCS